MSSALILKEGSTGQQVVNLQYVLNRQGFYSGSLDGIFGPKTKAAVVQFQRHHGLEADGIVGTATLKALGNLEGIGG
jgi:peptidoglycan hydrolase-like protein with peptidoglycan-binding domain